MTKRKKSDSSTGRSMSRRGSWDLGLVSERISPEEEEGGDNNKEKFDGSMPPAYNKFTMTFYDKDIQRQFDVRLEEVRWSVFKASIFVCIVVGIAVTTWTRVVDTDGGIVPGVLLILGGTAALVSFYMPPSVIQPWVFIARPALHFYSLILSLGGLAAYVHSEEWSIGSYLPVVISSLVLLNSWAMVGVTIHEPLPVFIMNLLALHIIELDAMLIVADSDDQHVPLAVSCVVFMFVITAAGGTFRMNQSCKNFLLFNKLLSAKDEQVNLKVHEEAERRKMNYVAQTLHDVGTPLATFALAIESLKTLTPVSQDQLEMLRTCNCAVELMTVTRRKAIDYATHYNGRELRPRLGSTNVRELVETKCRRIMSGFNSASIVPIVYDVKEGIAKYILTDGEFLWECLVNYLSNAVKFTNEGRIECNVFKLTPDTIRFEVRDTGIGIPHSKKQQLFQPFSQLQHFAGGTGLGLWSVKQKITALSGVVGVHDNMGGGSVFFFDIPYKPDFVLENIEAQAEQARAQDSSMNGIEGPDGAGGPWPGMGKRKILMVDNRPIERDVAVQLFNSHGYEVDCAINGYEGLRKMQKQEYFIVLLDFNVAVMDALKVLQQFRDWEESPSAMRVRAHTYSGAQFVCVMFSDSIHEMELPAAINTTINSGANAVWTDPGFPTATDICQMIEEEKKGQESTSDPEQAQAIAAALAAQTAQPATRKTDGCVLLIEDELSILKFEKRMFEMHGFEVETAINGKEGLQKMKKRMYDAVFTDIMMPVMDGYETVRQFRQWESTCAERTTKQVVYAVSANASERDHSMAHAVGMDGFASKPVKVRELVELVRRRKPTEDMQRRRELSAASSAQKSAR